MLRTVLAPLALLFLQDPPAPEAEPASAAVVEVRDRTGSPMPGASVAIEIEGTRGPTRLHLRTDDSGVAALPTSASGARFRAAAVSSGHVLSVHGAVEGRPIASERIVVVASPPSGIDVRLSGGGAPEGALLVLVTSDWQPHEGPDATAELISGANRVDAPPGIYLAMLHAPGAPVLTALRDGTSPAVVRVPAGGSTRLDLRVPALEAHEFRLVDALDGEPLARAELWPRTLGRGAHESYRWRTDDEGRFALRLPPPSSGGRGVAAISVYFGWQAGEREGSAGWVPPAPTLRAMKPQVEGRLELGELARERDVRRIELSRGADAAWSAAGETVALAIPGLTRVELLGRGERPVDVAIEVGLKQPGEALVLGRLIERRTIELDFGDEGAEHELELTVSSPRASGALHRVTTTQRIATKGRSTIEVWVPAGAAGISLDAVGRGSGGALLWARLPVRGDAPIALDRTMIALRRAAGEAAPHACIELPDPAGPPTRAIAGEDGMLALWSHGAGALVVSTDLETHPPTHVATGESGGVVTVPVAGSRTELVLVAKGAGDVPWWAELLRANDAVPLRAACFLDESGRLEIPYLPPGDYRVRLRREDGEAETEWTDVAFEGQLVVEFDVAERR